jgi:tetratricopeptide (TPR) repeat protein
MQGRPEDALAFYKMAVESGGQQERKGVYAAAYLEQLFVAQDLEPVADLIAMFHDQEWLPPQRIQYWYGPLGVELAKAGEKEAATAIAKRALADDLPATSPEVQPIHLHLGDLLVAQQRYPEAVVHYRLALAGEDERLAQLARTRLNEEQIRSIRVEVEGMF